ncbi:TlyA family RNA methyltransferase [Candidatus Margulisiibacteriota bacterium]
MKQRIDELLVEKKFFESRSRAQAAVMAGLVLANEKKIEKSGTKVDAGSNIRILGELHRFVSRGGVKLEHALKQFNIKTEGRISIDVGASTGGFTDCMLQHGAKKVYAVDVGYGQIAWKLRQDDRVAVLERMNARNLKKEDLYKEKDDPADLAVIDVSFISLGKIFPALLDLLADNAEVLALVKPQFEAGRDQVEKGGIVKNTAVHKQVLEKVSGEAHGTGFKVCGFTKTPIKGADGNQEFFIYLKKGKKAEEINISEEISNIAGGA